jgi:NADH-quinone oxidoreductase subunit M
MLTLFIFIPVVIGFALLTVRPRIEVARKLAMAVGVVELALSILFLLRFDRNAAGLQFEQKGEWLPMIGLQYHLGLDGIGLIFVVLTTLVFCMSLVCSISSARSDSAYFGFLLLLEGGLLGTYTALNFIHFFFFWELSLIPAFFLVRKYGGAKRSTAAIQFFIYTMVGSIAMLLGFLGLYLATGTFDLMQLAGGQKSTVQAALETKLNWLGLMGGEIKLGLFVLVLMGFAVKLPIWPFHSWLPLTYAEAPTPVTMVLTGVMSKMAVYGLVRILVPIFPDEIIKLNLVLLTLAAVTVVYGALAAMAQTDLKLLFAYASLSHLGYCALGAFAVPQKMGLLYVGSDAALTGVLLQAFSHGILATALFAFVSFLEQRNSGGRLIQSFGGLRNINPAFAGTMGIIIFASLGLPGLSAFPAEFLIFQGAFQYAPLITSFAALGILLTAIYSLTFFMKVFLGPLSEKLSGSPDLVGWEKTSVAPALILTFILGIYPQLATSFFNTAVAQITAMLKI